VLLCLRTVQAVVTHLEPFPKERANRACVRALSFGNFKVGAIKSILRNALDFAPLDSEQAQLSAGEARSTALRTLDHRTRRQQPELKETTP